MSHLRRARGIYAVEMYIDNDLAKNSCGNAACSGDIAVLEWRKRRRILNCAVQGLATCTSEQ